MAHATRSWEQSAHLPAKLKVFRSFAMDSARHLSILGHYPEFFQWPDRWVSWYPAAVLEALRLVRTYHPDVIWSTFPIATTQMVAMTVARISGLPWVADLRDSITDEEYPPPGIRRRILQRIERKLVKAADRVVFTAPGSLRMYAERYPEIPESHWRLVLNGFDEESFQQAETVQVNRPADKMLILHSGVIYPNERDPSHLFDALRNLKSAGKVTSRTLEVRLRGSGSEAQFEKAIQERGIGDIVKLLPSIPYHEALAEMMAVDALLLLQASNCNHQIPAKLFEYIRANRPILALTDSNGDTATLLNELGSKLIAPLDSEIDIAAALLRVIDVRTERRKWIGDQVVSRFSRRHQAQRTADIFDEMIQTR